jgi:membrane-associated phospholipid phosphatase
MEKVFEQVCKENNVEYPKELVENLINSAAGIVLDLKYHYNRPRPFQLASHYNMKLGEHVLESMKTPSYPSGHSTQGILVGKVLQTKLPINTDAFLEAGKRISYSRNIGRVHFPSDSKLGEDIGNALYQHIKHKI